MFFSTIFHVVDGTSVVLCASVSFCTCCFLILGSVRVKRIMSQIYEMLYSPMFLLRAGLLTLIHMDSLMVLVKLSPSLSTPYLQ